MIDYTKFTDQEINVTIAEIMYPGRPVIESNSRPPCAGVVGHETIKLVDYCNSPTDAWPIIYENKISLIGCLDMWIAAPYSSVIDGDTSESQEFMYVNSWKAPCLSHQNPIRAAMIVFLMMQDEKIG